MLAVAPTLADLPPLAQPPVYGNASRYKDRPYVFEGEPPRTRDERRPPAPFIRMAVARREHALMTGLSDGSLYRSSYGTPGRLACFEIEARIN